MIDVHMQDTCMDCTICPDGKGPGEGSNSLDIMKAKRAGKDRVGSNEFGAMCRTFVSCLGAFLANSMPKAPYHALSGGQFGDLRQ